MWFLLALLSALFAALTSILAKVGIEGVNSNLATAIRTVVVVVMAWGMVFLTNAQNGIAEISKRSWLFLVLSGLATGVSWLCYYKALQLLAVKDPCGSPSIRSTFLPSFASPTPRFITVVLFETPPFWFETDITLHINFPP